MKKNKKEKQNWGRGNEASVKETKVEVKEKHASHKSNHSTAPQGYVDWYSTLGHMGGGNRCGWATLMRVTTTQAA